MKKYNKKYNKKLLYLYNIIKEELQEYKNNKEIINRKNYCSCYLCDGPNIYKD